MSQCAAHHPAEHAAKLTTFIAALSPAFIAAEFSSFFPA
jgi:hypothetical protein